MVKRFSKKHTALLCLLIAVDMAIFGGPLYMLHRATTVHISDYVSPRIAILLAHQKAVLNKDNSGIDVSKNILYTNVDTSITSTLLHNRPKEIWKSCQHPLEQTHCYETWLTVPEIRDLDAIDDIRSFTSSRSPAYTLRQLLETNPDTRCALVADHEPVNGTVYLCVDGPDGIVAIGAFSS